MTTTQEELFEVLAKPIIEDVLNGINGTIFAYGQTGSGKTYTITGGTDRYEQRGLIPRSLSYVFRRVRERSEEYKVYISYLEIYQEKGYDLLTAASQDRRLDELPRVNMLEDDNGIVHLKNLSTNMAQDEEEGLNLRLQ
eukprot:GHVR01178814.1.p1 GENE.GHVR01178814.1~~GHVR01178814.1.p1  ORF type:complete len:139 (-),score=26.94 GHVR01178814.1:12-428(-)